MVQEPVENVLRAAFGLLCPFLRSLTDSIPWIDFGSAPESEPRCLGRAEGSYYNWDVEAHRRLLRHSQLEESSKLWVLDEIHKSRGWRNWLKGLYDLHCGSHSILVTGSARLDIYSRGGDSLQGRYFLYRLQPFTFSELLD